MEKIFFAPTKKEAIKYAKKVNKHEGFMFFNISKIHLAKKQNPNTDWKTWTDDSK